MTVAFRCKIRLQPQDLSFVVTARKILIYKLQMASLLVLYIQAWTILITFAKENSKSLSED